MIRRELGFQIRSEVRDVQIKICQTWVVLMLSFYRLVVALLNASIVDIIIMFKIEINKL